MKGMKSLLLLFGVLICLNTTAPCTYPKKITPDICPVIKPRCLWGAKPPKVSGYTEFPTEYVIIHHTVTPTCLDQKDCSRIIASMQDYHMNERNFNDITYNFIIGGDGEVYEGIGWHHPVTCGVDRKSVGIAFVGNFNINLPNAKQLAAAQNLIKCGVALEKIKESYKLLGARSVKATKSPGDALFCLIQNWERFARSA